MKDTSGSAAAGGSGSSVPVVSVATRDRCLPWWVLPQVSVSLISEPPLSEMVFVCHGIPSIISKRMLIYSLKNELNYAHSGPSNNAFNFVKIFPFF